MVRMDGLFSKFRWWLLLGYAIGWAMAWSLYIAFCSQFPPARESLGDERYFLAWRGIVIGGAITGAVLYLSNLYMQRVMQRFRQSTDSHWTPHH
jgi:hypothetical protein